MPLREPNSIGQITQLHDIRIDLAWAETLLCPTRQQKGGRRANITLTKKKNYLREPTSHQTQPRTTDTERKQPGHRNNGQPHAVLIKPSVPLRDNNQNYKLCRYPSEPTTSTPIAEHFPP